MKMAVSHPADNERSSARGEWLQATGPHALVRAVRAGAGSLVLAITLRPGTLTNSISALTVHLFADGELAARAEIPVFERYNEQWSIDLTTAVRVDGSGRHRWTGEIVLLDSLNEVSLPLLTAGDAAFALGAIPTPGAAMQPWQVDLNLQQQAPEPA